LIKNIIFTILVIFLAAGCGQGNKGEKAKVERAGTQLVKVQVISTKGCVSTPKTINLIQATANEIGAKIELDQIVISTQEEANKYKFHGSPTVLVNGLDLDRNMRDNTTYGFT
jgi:hypothetical protein